MIYPGIGDSSPNPERKKSVYLCTNGMFIRKKIADFKPSKELFFNVLSTQKKSHDIAVEREGVFDAAIDAHQGREGGRVLVCTNPRCSKRPRGRLDESFAF